MREVHIHINDLFRYRQYVLMKVIIAHKCTQNVFFVKLHDYLMYVCGYVVYDCF